MKLESQVCSLEHAKRLKELGVKQESYFMWVDSTLTYEGPPSVIREQDVRDIRKSHSGYPEFYSAFTVAELGEMLPKGYRSGKAGNPKKGTFKVYVNVCYSAHRDGYSHTTFEDTEADARAKMLIYLIENNLLSVEALMY